MRAFLSGKRGFWTAVAAAGVIVLLVAIFWVFPAHLKLGEAQKKYQELMDELRMVQGASADIPSMEAIQKRNDHRLWLDGQAEVAKRFFAERSELLETPLTGEGQANPAAFKEAYLNVLRTQMKWLEENKRRMAFRDMQQAFPAYPWMAGGELPDPSVYPIVLNDYWSRYYMQKILMKANVTLIKRLDVRQVGPMNEMFNAIPFSIDVTLSPDYVNGLVEQLQSLSRSEMSKPVIEIVALSMQPEILDTRPMLGVQIEGRFLLLKKELRPGGTAR